MKKSSFKEDQEYQTFLKKIQEEVHKLDEEDKKIPKLEHELQANNKKIALKMKNYNFNSINDVFESRD